MTLKPTTKLYLRAFILFGLPYAIFMTIFDVVDGNSFTIVKMLFLFIFFGGFMSAVLITMHLSRIKELLGVTTITAENLASVQQRVAVSSTTPTELKEKIISAFFLKPSVVNLSENQINYNTKISWYSWGEVVNIAFHPTADSSYEYTIICQNNWKYSIIDYGKNIENIKKIESLLL